MPTVITRAGDGVVVFANAACVELLGAQDGGLVGRTMVEAGFRPAPERRAAMLAELARHGRVTDFEEEIATRSGERMVVLISISHYDLDGEPCLIGHFHDITRRRVLEEQLRESEELYRLLAEYSTDVIGRLSGDGRIEYVSPASSTVYGYPPEVMIGRFGFEFIHPDDLAEMSADFSGRPDARGVITNSYRVRRGTGDYVWVEARIRALRDPETGEVVEFHTVARDVSERKAAEAEVRRAKETAERANEAKTEFLSRMSHELRTPLNAILGFAQLLDLDPAERRSPQQRDNSIRSKAGWHLASLINEVLDLSRIESARMALAIERVACRTVIEETLADDRADAAARGLHVRAHTPPEAPAPRRCRPPAPQAGAAQPALERGQVQPRRRRGAGRGDARGTPARAPRGRRHGHRHRARRRGERVLGVRAARGRGHRRRGDGAGARPDEAPHRGDGRHDRRRQRCRPRHDLLAAPVRGPGARAARRAPGGRAGAPGAQRPAHGALHRGQPVEHQARRDHPARAGRGHPARRAAGQARPRARVRPRARARAARSQPAGHLGRGDLAPAARGRADGRHPGGDRQRGCDRGPGPRLLDAGADGYLTKPFDIEQLLAAVDGVPATHGQPEADPALDRSTVHKLLRLHPDGRAVKELVEIYLADAPVRLAALEHGVAARNPDAVGPRLRTVAGRLQHDRSVPARRPARRRRGAGGGGRGAEDADELAGRDARLRGGPRRADEQFP